MLRLILHAAARAFEKRYTYDGNYMHDVIDVSVQAGLGLAVFPALVQYRGPKAAVPVWAGAMLASSMDGDCGSCAQLVLDMAVEQGASPDHLRACLQGDWDAAGGEGLGYRFGVATILDAPDQPDLAADILAGYGKRGLMAASFAAASGRFYPVLKRGLGHGQTCEQLRVAGERVALVR